MEERKFIHSVDQGRFFVMDGSVQMGFLGYKLRDKVMYINTTYVDPKYRNRSLGKVLVDRCAQYAREENFKISPVCPYVVKLFERTKEYDDVKI